MLRATRTKKGEPWKVEPLEDTFEEMEREMARCAIEYFDPTEPPTRPFPPELWAKVKPRSE